MPRSTDITKERQRAVRRVRELLRAPGATVEAVAVRFNVSAAQVARWRDGKSLPHNGTAQRILNAT